MKLNLKKLKEDPATGFSNRTDSATRGRRFLNRDGSMNITKRGLGFLGMLDVYERLIIMSWPAFFGLTVLFMVGINLVFACVYEAIGLDQFNGIPSNDHDMSHFLEVFFFSTQTFTTVGYGRINPAGNLAGLVSSLQSMTGLLAVAIFTGITYARFARPKAAIAFSDVAIFAPYKEGMGFMLRLVNKRQSHFYEPEISVNMSIVLETNGTSARHYFALPLERDKINFLSLSWTVVHPINEESPFYSLTPADLENGDMEVMVLLKGFDEAYSQPVYAAYSYRYPELVFGAKFTPMFGASADDSATEVYLDKISAYERVTMPQFQPTPSKAKA